MRPERHLVDLAHALVVDPALDQVRGEDAAAGQVVVVDLQRVEDFHQRSRRALDLALQLGLELVEVFVDRLGWLDLVDDAVETGHQAGGEGEVRITRWVRRPELKELRLGILEVHRTSYSGDTIALWNTKVHWGFVNRRS